MAVGLGLAFRELLLWVTTGASSAPVALPSSDVEGMLFDPARNGSYEVWRERPLRPALVEYAALDVSTLHDLHAAWGHLVSEEEMARITGRRIKAAVEGEGRAKGARMAERDF